eukprot:gene1741-510_t
MINQQKPFEFQNSKTMEKVDPLVVLYTSKIILLPFENYKTKKEIEQEEENQIEKETTVSSLFSGLPFGITSTTLEFICKYILENKIKQKIESKPLQQVAISLISTLISYPFDVLRKREVKVENFEDPTHIKPLKKKYFKGLSMKLIFNSLSLGIAEYTISQQNLKFLENEKLNRGLILGLSRLLLYPLEMISSRAATSFEPSITTTSTSAVKKEGFLGLYKTSWTSVIETAYNTLFEYALN